MKLRLHEFTLDAGTRQLMRGRSEIHLSPKAFELLRILIDERPRAVSKQDLHRQLWPNTFVSESNLATLIREIRGALGDSAREPRFVRTANRFGYAFCADALEIAEGIPGRDSTPLCWLVKDGRRLPLSPGENVLGREAGGGLHIDSVTVSRRHARIVVSDAVAMLEDLHSKNGTFVNGERIAEPTPLDDGVEIRTGSVVFRFRMASPKGSTATASKSGL